MQALQKVQEELKLRAGELRAAEEKAKRLINEKVILEERISTLEKKKTNEVVLPSASYDFVCMVDCRW